MSPATPPRRRLPRLAAAALLVLLPAAGAAVWWGSRRAEAPPEPPPARPEPRPAPPDPRLTYTGPLLNVRPGVKYVGTDTCAAAGCHADKAATYRDHPMGRSIVPIRALAGRQPYDAAHNDPFEALDSRFLVERDGDRVRHRRTGPDLGGRPVYDFALDVAYALGSGAHGYSYLTDRDGYLYQTPISWYAQRGRWDLSPGFGESLAAGRPMGGPCMFCHVNRAEPAEGTLNLYRPPLFDGQAIGCERCHGPGELHAAARRQKADDEFTIVHPGRLTADLRDAVCEQCHLEGAARVVRRGRRLSDFRPGLPLSDFLAVFVPERTPGDDDRAVNHVEQMRASGCYRGGTAAERMGCVSCHDPHEHVAPAERVAHYRRACLACHDKHGCSVPLAERVKASKEDSCIDCHMPRYSSADIPHTASTDHRVPRRRGKAPAGVPHALPPGGLALRPFHAALANDPDVLTRDLGLALAEVVGAVRGPGGAAAPRPLSLLGVAVANDPDDWPAREARADLLARQGLADEALDAYRAVLAGAPRREPSLAGAAQLSTELHKHDEAVGYWRRAVAVNPTAPKYRVGLCRALDDRGDWADLRGACDDALRLDPANVQARALRTKLLLHDGRKAEAAAEFDKIKALRPPDLAEFQAWFDRQSK